LPSALVIEEELQREASQGWVCQKSLAENHILWFSLDRFFEREIFWWFLLDLTGSVTSNGISDCDLGV
jgi:hypothetical protein